MRQALTRIRKKADLVSLTFFSRLVPWWPRLVPYRIGVWAGGAIGSIAYYLLRRERARATEHLRLVFPDRNRAWLKRTARSCFSHLGKSLFEMVLMTPRRLGSVATIVGEENLKEAYSRGKGVVYVTGHIGNWELMAQMIGSRYPLSVVAAPLKPESVNDLIISLRSRMNVQTIVRSRPGAARELIRAFRENRVLGILIDQDTDVEGAFVDFMGMPAWTPTAAASMSLKFGAPVVFGAIKRGAGNRHVITIEGPFHFVQTGNEQQDIIAATGVLTKRIEDCIRQDPEQWVWMHRRWRRKP